MNYEEIIGELDAICSSNDHAGNLNRSFHMNTCVYHHAALLAKQELGPEFADRDDLGVTEAGMVKDVERKYFNEIADAWQLHCDEKSAA